MKRSISQILAVAVLATSVNFNVFAESSPGEVDFGKLPEAGKGAEFVEINVGRNLTSLAAKLVEKQQPDAAQLLRSVELVRVNVIGLTDENRDRMQKRVHEIRSRLDKNGWERVVTVQQKTDQDVGVYVKTRGDEAVEGIVVTVLDGNKQAVLINVVGNIKPEQLAAVGEALNIQPLKKAGEEIKKQSN